jgi:hypothetical protein
MVLRIVSLIMICTSLSFSQLLAQVSTFYVRDFGARGDGISDDTKSIQTAIDEAGRKGGGHVIISPGNYVIGPIHLKSNLTFEIEAGATLWCTENVGAFFKTGRELTTSEISKWKGLHTDYQMINGSGLENVTITGKGTINGQGRKVWWTIQDIRPYVMKIENSKNIFFENLFVTESPFHTFNFSNVEGLVVSRITLRNDPKSPNTDGLHFFKCKYVRVSEVDFDTGDDCILTPGSTDVTVSNSRFRTPWGVWWPSGTCSRITITNCVVDCQMLIKDFRNAENVIIDNIVATGPGRLFSCYGGPMKNIMISNVIADGWSQGGWFINGENIILSNIHISRKPGSGNEILKNGFVFSNVRGLTLRNVTIDSVESGSALYCENISGLEIDCFRSSGVPANEPVISLSNANTVYMHGNQGRSGEIFARISGSGSRNISYSNNDWNGGFLEVSPEVPSDAVKKIRGKVVNLTLPKELDPDTPFLIGCETESLDHNAGLYPLKASVDNGITANIWVWLEPGEKKMISLEGPKLYKAKHYNISVNDVSAVPVSVRNSKGRLTISKVDLDWRKSIARVGDTIHLEVFVKNTGGTGDEFPVILKCDRKEFSRQNISLNPGEERVLSFDYVSHDIGLKLLTINDLWEGAVKFYSEPVESVFLKYTFENIVDSLITDGSGLGNHGQLGANKGGTLPEVENGIAGKAMRFNGSSSYVKIPRMLLRFPMTISVWVKPGSLTETSTAGRQMIFYVSEPMGNDGYGPEPEIHLMRSEGNTFVFWANAGRQRIDLRHPIGEEGTWTHIAIVYDETSTMYINGEPVSSQTGIKPPLLDSFAERIYIGRPNVDYLRYFNGTLDEITFFNEALDAKEVKELFRRY